MEKKIDTLRVLSEVKSSGPKEEFNVEKWWRGICCLWFLGLMVCGIWSGGLLFGSSVAFISRALVHLSLHLPTFPDHHPWHHLYYLGSYSLFCPHLGLPPGLSRWSLLTLLLATTFYLLCQILGTSVIICPFCWLNPVNFCYRSTSLVVTEDDLLGIHYCTSCLRFPIWFLNTTLEPLKGDSHDCSCYPDMSLWSWDPLPD